MTYRIAPLSLLGVTVFASGCVEAPTTIERTAKGCSNWGCGYNSPVLDTNKGFHELNLEGKPNEANLSLHNPPMVRDGVPFRLAIENNRFVGHLGDWPALAGQNLVGAEILIDTPDLQPAYAIVIKHVQTIEFPFYVVSPSEAKLWRPDELEVYELGWRSLAPSAPAPERDNLCSNPPEHLGNDRFSFNELLGMGPREALIFAGDRIDVTAKTMSRDGDPAWFNIGCAGDTLAKLHLMRNTLASDTRLSPAPSHDKRQATLKLLTADYCGTGRSFTVPWQPLQWKGHSDDAVDEYLAAPPVAEIEARWNQDGAICLSRPRMEVSTLNAARELFPNASEVRAAIDAECEAAGRQPIPWCDPKTPDILADELRVSAHPSQLPVEAPPVEAPPVEAPTVDNPFGLFRPISSVRRQKVFWPFR